MSKTKRIILGVTGSIAAYKSAEILRRLQENGHRVSVVMTKAAEEFITPLTLSSLAQEPVYREMFGHIGEDFQMPHIKLAREADLVLIAPATANIIAKMAHGIADDLLTCLILGTKAPILIAPAMNTEMFKNAFVQENCKRLKTSGVQFIDPVEGDLACGTRGDGHIAHEDDIVKAVLKAIK